MFLKTLNLSTINFFEILCWHRGKFGTSIHYWVSDNPLACGFRWIILSKWNPLKKKKKKKIKPNGRIGRIPYDPMILCDSTHSYIRSYHFCDPTTILNFLVRWDCKIVRFYDSDRNFDNYDHQEKRFKKMEIDEN